MLGIGVGGGDGFWMGATACRIDCLTLGSGCEVVVLMVLAVGGTLGSEWGLVATLATLGAAAVVGERLLDVLLTSVCKS